MKRETLVIAHGIAVLSSLVLLTGCSLSSYQSFTDQDGAEQILSQKKWEVALPYSTGENLTIQRVSDTGILICDPQGDFHLTRIPLDAQGEPGTTQHLPLENGESCEELEGGELLVSGRDGNEDYVSVVDPESLKLRFSKTLAFPDDEELSIPGKREIGGRLLFFRTNVKVSRHSWSDATYQYSVPYISSSAYDIHVVDLHSGDVRSLTGLDPKTLPDLSDILDGSMVDALRQQREKSFPSLKDVLPAASSSKIDDYIYLLNDFFLVDSGNVLIFSLENQSGRTLYYSGDLRSGAGSVRHRDAAELAAEYPGELVATVPPEREKVDRLKSREVSIAGMTVRPDRFAILPGGLVMVAQPKGSGDSFLPQRYILGVRLLGDDFMDLEKRWEYRVKHSYGVGTLLEDPEGAVYFPEQEETGSRFRIRGLTAAEGQELPGFPANFKISGKEDASQALIVGTAVNFDRRVLYIHDADEHRLLCLPLPRSTSNP